MKRYFVLSILLLLPLSMLGCGNKNSAAPPDNQAHASTWIKTHPASALATANFADCTSCHGASLQGSGEAVSCYSCHAFNSDTNFIIHPTSWTDAYTDHRNFAATNGSTTCAKCHGADLHGSPAAPSCFSSTYNALGCHPAGPGNAPHPLDGSFLNPANHGPVAKADLTVCQACHADAGGPGSNPRFNKGILSAGGTGCEACHGAYYAHPAGWAGPTNNTFHYSAGNTEACKLCHGAALDGVGGVDAAGNTPGLSCLSCHAEVANFTLDCTACHSYPPVAGDVIDSTVFPVTAQLVDHTAPTTGGTVADKGPHAQCATCHGVKGAAGILQANSNYLLFDKTTDTLGSHWNGKIEMNGPSSSDPAGGPASVGAGYNSTTFSCDNAGCHGPGFALSDSHLPVGFGDFGVGANHAVGQSWLLPSGHVAAANGPSPDCFSCHAQTGSSPVTGAPACQDCHLSGDPLVVTACASCHTAPPSLASIATVDRPDRAGKHAKHNGLTIDTTSCMSCHTGGGTGSLTHFDRTGNSTTPNYPADVVFLGASYNSQASTAAYNTGTMSCSNVICHGGVTTPNWYTGSINVYSGNTADCQKCHASSNEHNAYASGQHNRHISNGFATCVSCHDTTVLQNGVAGDSHFSGLKTTAFELNPQLTINSNVNYNGTSCNPACHGTQAW